MQPFGMAGSGAASGTAGRCFSGNGAPFSVPPSLAVPGHKNNRGFYPSIDTQTSVQQMTINTFQE